MNFRERKKKFLILLIWNDGLDFIIKGAHDLWCKPTKKGNVKDENH